MNILNRLKCAAVLGLTLLSPMFATDAAATAASFTTTNMAVDGPGHCYNGGTGGDPVNCNIYDAKPHVWMNGGPIGEAVGPGKYFFVIFHPSGQSNPNDGSPNLLSYDIGGDPYTNRSFIINADLSITYGGNHDMTGKNIRLGLNPDGAGLNLDDWYETTPNNGGEYTIGICRLADDMTQLAHKDCKFDAFKLVKVDAPVCDANHPELCPPVCDEAHPELCPGCDEAHPELCPQCECGGTYPDCKSCAVGPILNISKDANGTYDRAITWGITKSVTNGALVRYLLSGSTQVDYQVVVTKGTSVTNVKVAGTITIDNSGDEATTPPVNVTDVLDESFGSLPCTITDPTQFDIIQVSGSASSAYVCNLPDGQPNDLGTNTATVTYAGLDENGDPTTKQAATVVGFGFTETLTGSDCAAISDLFNGTTTVNIGTGSTCEGGTFTYSKTINVASGCVAYPNVASVTPDGGSAITDDEAVTVCGPVQSGAHTIGFWQNKNGQGKIKGAGNDSETGNCTVYEFLAGFAPFADIKTTTDGSCTQTAAWVFSVVKSANAGGSAMNAMLKAQMMGSALSSFFFPGVNAFQVDLTRVWGNQNTTAAFGGSTCLTVPQLLAWASALPQYIGPPPGNWYGQNKGMQGLAKNTFDAINNQMVFECIAP